LREHNRQRHREDDGQPQSDAERTADGARIARAIGLRNQRRDRRHCPHAEHEHTEEDRVRERSRRQRLVAKAADQRQIRGHHRDLAKLRQRNRHREPDRLGQLGANKAFGRNGCRFGAGNSFG
jgi:hypothetical protein